jgi:hypothetical protein
MPPFGQRIALLLILLCSVSVVAAQRPIGQRQRKRVRSSSAGTHAESVLSRAFELLHITTPPFVFNAKAHPGAKTALIDALWAGAWMADVASRFADSNPALRYLLELQQVETLTKP